MDSSIDTTLAKEVKIMTTKTVQEIYDSISTVNHAPTAREMVDAMIADGYTNTEVKTQLTSTYLNEKKAEKDAYRADRNTRIPTQAAWNLLTDSEKLTEWNLEGKYDFAIGEATRIQSEFNTIITSFNSAKGTAQDEFNSTWNEKETSGWVI